MSLFDLPSTSTGSKLKFSNDTAAVNFALDFQKVNGTDVAGGGLTRKQVMAKGGLFGTALNKDGKTLNINFSTAAGTKIWETIAGADGLLSEREHLAFLKFVDSVDDKDRDTDNEITRTSAEKVLKGILQEATTAQKAAKINLAIDAAGEDFLKDVSGLSEATKERFNIYDATPINTAEKSAFDKQRAIIENFAKGGTFFGGIDATVKIDNKDLQESTTKTFAQFLETLTVAQKAALKADGKTGTTTSAKLAAVYEHIQYIFPDVKVAKTTANNTAILAFLNAA